MQHSSTAATRKIYSLQALRAYAAISVMLGHGILEFHTTRGMAMPFNEFPLIAGVDIFFVLSGFVMFHTAGEMFGRPGAVLEFWRKRFIRLVPLYWFFTSLMVGVLLFLGNHVRSTEFDVWNVISSYLFIPSERPGGRVAPVLSLGWTLNYEMFFYFTFGLFLLLGKRNGLMFLIFSFLSLIALTRLDDFGFVPLRFWGNSIILEFIFGVSLGVFRNRGHFQKSIPFCLAIFLLGLIVLLMGCDLDVPRFVKGGLPATMLVYAALALPSSADRKIPAWVILLGDSSYALYLCHRFVLRAVTMLFARVAIPAGHQLFLYVLATVAGSVILSIVVHKLIEGPLLKLLSNGKRRADPEDAIILGDAPANA